jgi:hypothetical protein
VHDAAGWVTWTLRPATVTDVLRACSAALVAASSVIVPEPTPVAPVAIVNQVAPLAADHVHPGVAVTPTEAVPPPTATAWIAGESP